MTEDLLLLMRDEVRAKGARLAVVLVSNEAQVDPDPKRRAEYGRRCGIEYLSYPNRRIAALGARASIPVLDLVPGLREHAERHGAFVHGFGSALGVGHWNQEGHRVAGELIAAWLAPLL